MTNEEIEQLADMIVAKLREEPKGLVVHVLEHEVIGGGRVVNERKARATPCTCFKYEGEEYCWSPGVLGLLSSKKNPEQIAEFCVLGKHAGGAGARRRFAEIKSAVGEAHKEWQEEGGGLREWWNKVGEKVEEKGLEF